MLDSFQPAVDTNGQMVSGTQLSVTGTSQISALPAGGEEIEFTNEDDVVIHYYKFLKSSTVGTVTAATGLTVMPGQSKIYKCIDGAIAVAYIGSGAGPTTAKMVAGNGF